MREAPLFAAPRARLRGGFVRRLEALVRRAAGRRERGEHVGRGRAPGGGDEFVGHRAYRPGEDVRHLDWALYARLERPFVRVHRREAGERWRILLDTSGSMGLGQPGKLQLAAELALGLAVAGQRIGATSELIARGPGPAELRRSFSRRRDLPAWIAALESLQAEAGGGPGLGELLSRAGPGRRVARLFVLGDFLDAGPAQLLGLQRPGRRVELVQVLAPHELAPAATGEAAVRWADRETAERLEVGLDAATRARYAEALGRHEEVWRRACARHGLGWSTWSSATPFEDVVATLLGI
jgi:uncharacterized protein (DUF58 family)